MRPEEGLKNLLSGSVATLMSIKAALTIDRKEGDRCPLF